MPEENQVDPASQPIDYLNPMLELINSSALTLNTQDLQEITIILQKGRSLYNKASKVYDAQGFELRLMEMCLLNFQATYLTVKAAYSKLTEKFVQAFDEYHQIAPICLDGQDLIKGLLIESHPKVAAALYFYQVLFDTIQFTAEGEALEMEHEIKVERGEFSDQSAVFLASAEKYRKINAIDIPIDNDNPAIPAFIKLLNRLALIKEDKAHKIQQQNHSLKHLPIKSKKIFLIHGHADGALAELQEILEKKLGLECVILKKESNQGDAVIEKFERYAGECGYAIAILSSDDLVRKKENKYFQARPNVLFEMGWFYGRYGRKNVCMLKQKGVEMPSDLGGVICLEYDQRIAEVFLDLEKELASLGFVA